MQPLKIADKTFQSRLILGSGKFGTVEEFEGAIIRSKTEMVTLALKRLDKNVTEDKWLNVLLKHNIQVLPNTSGARTAKGAVLAAQLAREALQTNWIKLEIHPDPKYLMPDPIETLKATEILAKDGFVVLPYIHADPVLCKHLENVGAAAVMPLGAPIGTNKGLRTFDFIKIIIEQSNLPVIVDAGLGLPSHAALAMEIGADAVLVNTAIAVAKDPAQMAEAFRLAVEAGLKGRMAGYGAVSEHAIATSGTENIYE
ncbi:MAG: thiazole synthase [Bacteroidia bacterium]|nr:MAG: thiazole synthase [Bacteroidia bacterium]